MSSRSSSRLFFRFCLSSCRVCNDRSSGSLPPHVSCVHDHRIWPISPMCRHVCDFVRPELARRRRRCVFIVLMTQSSSSSCLVAMLVFGLGAAAGPSLWSLIMLAATSSEMGRVLAGFSALNAAATALSSPTFRALFSATRVKMPGFAWLFASVRLMLRCWIVPRMLTSFHRVYLL